MLSRCTERSPSARMFRRSVRNLGERNSSWWVRPSRGIRIGRVEGLPSTVTVRPRVALSTVMVTISTGTGDAASSAGTGGVGRGRGAGFLSFEVARGFGAGETTGGSTFTATGGGAAGAGRGGATGAGGGATTATLAGLRTR